MKADLLDLFGSSCAFSAEQAYQWCCVGGATISVNQILSSRDGVTFTPSSNSVFNGDVSGVCYGQQTWVAAGSGSVHLAYSSDTKAWRSSSFVFSSSGRSCAYSPYLRRFVACGIDAARNIAYSDDGGITWTPVASQLGSSVSNSVFFANNLFVAVGNNAPEMVSSPNGISWTAVSGAIQFSPAMAGIAFGGSLEGWIAVGGQAISSVQLLPADLSIGMLDMSAAGKFAMNYSNSVAFSELLNRWIIVGGRTNGTVLSGRPNNWTSASPFLYAGLGVAVRRDVFQFNLSQSISGGVVIVPDSAYVLSSVTVTVLTGSTLIVQGDLTLDGSLSLQGNALVNGSFVSAGTLQISYGTTLTAISYFTVSSTSSNLEITNVPAGVSTFRVATFGLTSVGTFMSVSVNGCKGSQALFSSSTLSVTVSPCITGLSAGAIVGISIGAAVGVALLTIAFVLLMKHLLTRADRAANVALKDKELEGLRV